jgi:hypothetical protein
VKVGVDVVNKGREERLTAPRTLLRGQSRSHAAVTSCEAASPESGGDCQTLEERVECVAQNVDRQSPFEAELKRNTTHFTSYCVNDEPNMNRREVSFGDDQHHESHIRLSIPSIFRHRVGPDGDLMVVPIKLADR